MTTQILKVKGMHCASCASIITKKLSTMPHIQSVSVNYGNEKAKIDYDNSHVSIDSMNKEIGKLGYSLVSGEPHTPKSLSVPKTLRPVVILFIKSADLPVIPAPSITLVVGGLVVFSLENSLIPSKVSTCVAIPAVV